MLRRVQLMRPFIYSAVLLTLFSMTSLLAQVRKGQWTPGVDNSERGYASIAYWTYRDDGVEIAGGRITLDYGRPAWRAQWADEAAFDQLTKGRIWRLGKDMWTNLDTQLALTVAGKKVDPGYYYLGARRSPGGDWSLVLVDPEAVRGGYIDAWAFVPRPDEVPILMEIPLKHSQSAETASQLNMTLELPKHGQGVKDEGRLTIHWGPHLLQADFKISVPPPGFYKER
ncbi:MAG TPA: DUF2911 domain-containing protein [Acidobacteriota bacterium]|nr:DUF2911 domain-containing protein [Acidobacteriota bacterium]